MRTTFSNVVVEENTITKHPQKCVPTNARMPFQWVKRKRRKYSKRQVLVKLVSVLGNRTGH